VEARPAAPGAEPAPRVAPAAWSQPPEGAALRALAAAPDDLVGARPLDGVRDRGAEWEWTYAGAGPVKAAEALL
jgi:hypothetical protein